MEQTIDEFQEKVEIEFVDFQLFADVGIHALHEAMEWLKESIGKYDEEVGTHDVKRDAARLMSTYKNKIEQKMEYCAFEGNEKDDIKRLENQDDEELKQKLENIMGKAATLYKYLKVLEDYERGSIIKKFEKETAKLKTNLQNIAYTKQQPDEMTFMMRKIGRIQKTLQNQNLSAYYPKMRSSLKFVANDLSSGNKEDTVTKTLRIGDIPWRVDLKIDKENLKIRLKCEHKSRGPTWSCIVKSEIRVLNQLNSDQCFKDFQADSVEKHDIVHEILMKNLLSENLGNGYFKDGTIFVDMDITVLEYAGIPAPEHKHKNLDFERKTNTISEILESISKLEECKIISSKTIDIGGFPWKMRFTQDEIMIYCNFLNNTSSSWSCTAKIEFRILFGSQTDAFYSDTVVREFHHEISCCVVEIDDLYKLVEQNYVNSDDYSITIQAIVTVYENLFEY